MFRTRSGRYGALVVTVVVLLIVLVAVLANQTASISGIVVSEDGVPIESAIVRIQATETSTTTGVGGTFALTGLKSDVEITVSAWKEYYYCVKEEHVIPPAEGLKLVLRLYQTDDNSDFEWTLPISDDPDVLTCSSCKPGVTGIWLGNAHAGAGTNRRFFSMYNGTDTLG
ncbi:carboxypeptidase regulatory-like domain-containing protein, partial [Candidatus Bipolaricaulota bacterium]|nr:carboxypeptidase regulatory-like domain-containing protein [Candidatus Bipolaricaulota bacterium]